MIENAKGITLKKIEKHINVKKHYHYEDLHQLAAELVLKDTHETKPIVNFSGDGWSGSVYCLFKSKVQGLPDIKTIDFYGSCSLCDTLLSIYENSNGVDTIKKDLATMVLHVIQSMHEQLDNK